MKELHDIQKAAKRLLALTHSGDPIRSVPISEAINLCADALEAKGQADALRIFNELVGKRLNGANARSQTSFGAWAKWVRRVHNISLYEMAKTLRISSSTLNGYETGRAPVELWVVEAIEKTYKSRFKV